MLERTSDCVTTNLKLRLYLCTVNCTAVPLSCHTHAELLLLAVVLYLLYYTENECNKYNTTPWDLFIYLLTFRGPRLQSVLPGVDVLLVQGVSPCDALGVWEAQLGVPPNVHATQQDLCSQTKHKRGSATFCASRC